MIEAPTSHFIRLHLYEMSRIGKFIETESKLGVSRAWEEEEIGGGMVSFGYDDNILELDCGDGCTF